MSPPLAYLNGELVAEADVHISPRDGGLLRGEGLFETLLLRNGTVVDPAAHLQRLFASLPIVGLQIPETSDALGSAIEAVGASLDGPHGRVRVTLTAGAPGMGATRLITVTAREPLAPDQRWALATWRGGRISSTDPLRAVKSTSYQLECMALQQARAAGADEALLLNERGNAVEGTRTNLIVELQGALLTPPLADGCLPGTVRRRLLQAAVMREASIPQAALGEISAAWLSNALIGVVAVARLDDRELATEPQAGRLEAALQEVRR